MGSGGSQWLAGKVSQILETEDISDIELINRIAEEIGVRGWFVWVGLEDMPESYYLSSRLES